jgi:hypothetical protein
LQTKKHAYLRDDVLSHAQTASDKEAEATNVPEAALVTAIPFSAAVADKPEILVHPRPTKASCKRCKKSGSGSEECKREQESPNC